MTINQKVKMKLVQPKIKCSGRDDVSCHYRGIVTHVILPGFVTIKFKQHGQWIEALYNEHAQQFDKEEYKDIKVV